MKAYYKKFVEFGKLARLMKSAYPRHVKNLSKSLHD